jgi:hypothetical protein
VPGTNQLAAEVHQSSLGSSDLGFDLRLSLLGYALGPALLSQPANASAEVGSNFSFMVEATGSAPLTYRWYFNNALLPGGSNSLTLSNIQPANVGNYLVVVSNSVGTVTSRVAVLSLVSSDADGDGMPDDWEIANGTNPGVSDASDDPDNDGLSNLQEYWAGTSPTNAASALKFDSVKLTGSSLVFAFTAIPNRSYTIEYQTTGTEWQKWQDVGAGGNSRTVWLTNSGASVETDRFYRLVTPQQP